MVGIMYIQCLYKALKKPLKFKTCELLNGLLYVEPNSLNSAFTFFLANCFAT